MTDKPICPKCSANEVIKNGNARGKPRFKCKKCNLQFTRITLKGYPPETRARVIELYNHGLSIRAAAKLAGVSRTSALNWIKELAKKIYEKPAPGTAILVELDEMWHYLGSKKNKLWIWKAYRRETGELIDWECGGRDKATFKRLIDRLLKWKVELFCTDNWAVYQEVIDEDRLFQGKTQTYYLEQNNGRQRHWYARFRRKSIVVSKTLEMVDLTMALFARFHVNGTGKNLISLLN